MKSKYNWKELKNLYLISEILDVREFLRQELGNNEAISGNTLRKTKGWKEEKETFKKEEYSKAFEQLKLRRRALDVENIKMAQDIENKSIKALEAYLNKGIVIFPQKEVIKVNIPIKELKMFIEVSRLIQGKNQKEKEENNIIKVEDLILHLSKEKDVLDED